MKYFKKNSESCNHTRTIYGCYDTGDITPEGDILCAVDDIDWDSDCDHIKHEVYQDYVEQDEIKFISEEEYRRVRGQIQVAEGLLDAADFLLRNLF